jgi:lysophospholipase L1-like esterase
MDVPQQLEVRDAGDRGVAPSGGQGYAGLRSAIERARQGGGPVRILHYGASHTVAGIEANTFESLLEQQAPVDYTRQAKNGISASYPLSRKQEWLDEPIQRTRPDLVVVEFGNNDGAAPINKARYARQFEELILSIKQRAPNASIMIMGPTDGCSIQGANKGNLLPGLTDVIAVQKEIAAKYSIDYFDIRQAMGGAGSVYEWRQRGLVSSDLLHFTKSGYEELGRMRYDHLRSRISS